MRSLILLIFLVSCKLTTFGQQATPQDTMLKGIDVFKLGDSIVKFKGLLTRANGKNDNTPINFDDSLSCWAFNYQPAFKDSIIIGDVKFTQVILSPNKQKVIIIVNFFANYLKTKFTNPKKAAKDDYRSLIHYVSKQLKQRPKNYHPIFSVNSPTEQGKIWTKNNVEFVLRKVKFNAPKADMKYMLDFSYAFKGLTQF